MIDDSVMSQLRQQAAKHGQTISELVEAALRSFLKGHSAKLALPPLPHFDGGGSLVDVSDRDALYRAMDGQ